MSQQERWTVGRLLQWTTDYLKKNGSSSARLDAEILLAEARNCQRIQLYTAFDEEPDEPIRTKFRDLVKRRAAGEPVAYLVGRREFYSLTFQVSPAVLIPRPETEFVVIAVLDAVNEMGGQQAPIQIADVGTGSGAIAVSVAKHAPNALLTAIDVNADALAVANENAKLLQVIDRITFVESNLFAAIPPERRFDIIASNPPYVADNEESLMSPETRQFEPRLALIAGPTGLEVISRLITEAVERLNAHGRLIFEISPMLEAKARALLDQSSAFDQVKITKDLAGLPRVITGRRL
jgi:release factor glutamine methyltransferase